MEPIRSFADAWMPVLGIHTMEVSAFILLVWAADRLLRLDTRLRYGLYLMALVKVFVPPLFLLPSAPIRVMAPTQVFVPPATGEILPDLAMPAQIAAFSWPSWTVVALTLWAASILVMAAITVCQNLRLRRTLRDATPIPCSKFKVQSSRSESTTLNLEPSHLELFRIFSTPTIHAPVLVGLFRPRLYLPEDWTSLPEAQVRGILAHESAHLRARDPYVLIPQALALVLFGFNPLVWLLCARLTYLRELRCDEAAIGETGIDPVDYSRLLYGFVQKQSRPSRLAVTGTYFSEHPHTVLKRFRHILIFKEGLVSRRWWHYAAPVLLGLMILPLSVQGRAKPE